jgi:hypothetical protein
MPFIGPDQPLRDVGGRVGPQNWDGKSGNRNEVQGVTFVHV